jgi:hypothetical protein
MSDMAFRVHSKRGVMDVIGEQDASTDRVSLWVIAAGAAAGALVGYVLRTPRGQRVFDDVIVMLEDFASDCARFSQAIARAQLAASDSWHAVTRGGASRSTGTR